MNNSNKKIQRIAYTEIVMALLALTSGGLFIFEIAVKLTPEQIQIVDDVDFIIAMTFLIEFMMSLFKSRHKKHFLKGHWWELLAAIPITTPETQALRLLRAVRVLRIFRGVFRTGVHLKVVRDDRG